MRRKSSTPFSSSTTNSEATTYYFSNSIFFKVMILFLNKNRFFSVRFITLSIINIFDQLESIIIFTLLQQTSDTIMISCLVWPRSVVGQTLEIPRASPTIDFSSHCYITSTIILITTIIIIFGSNIHMKNKEKKKKENKEPRMIVI